MNSISPAPMRAVVTGASSGIGQQIAVRLAEQFSAFPGGCQLVIHYRSNVQGAAETERLAIAQGAKIQTVQADICDKVQRKNLVKSAWDFLGQPNTWINNAGADVLTGRHAKLSFSQKLHLLLQTDVESTIALSRDVIEKLKANINSSDSSQGHVPPSMTFIGWDQAPHGMEGDAGQMFGPVKAAVMAFANSLAQEVAPAIRVNTVAPGWIQTAWGQSTDEYWDARAKRQSLMQRWGTADDVARCVCFVADPANSFCCGQTLIANGGWDRTVKRDPPA